jgi:hypothetical protein
MRCSALGVEERMRVPFPAAITIVVQPFIAVVALCSRQKQIRWHNINQGRFADD